METTERISLLTICQGSAPERFDHELQQVLENIMDPNREATAAREIILKVTIKPDEDRELLRTSLIVTKKLAPLAPVKSTALFGKDIKGRPEAHEIKPAQQQKLPIGHNVTPINKEG